MALKISSELLSIKFTFLEYQLQSIISTVTMVETSILISFLGCLKGTVKTYVVLNFPWCIKLNYLKKSLNI